MGMKLSVPYMTECENPGRAGLGWKFGRLSDRLTGHQDSENLKCHVHMGEPGLRPTIELEPTDHPLAVQQREGITFEEPIAYAHEHLEL
jgi:hypothetical protein